MLGGRHFAGVGRGLMLQVRCSPILPRRSPMARTAWMGSGGCAVTVAWQSRPLDEVYPILYIDGLRLRIGDNGVITTKVAYLAIGVDLEGRKHALGCWIQDSEGAKFWQKVVIDLRNRGVRDILITCCDGLTGLPDAIRSIFPDTVVQTCVVHVIRNAMRFVSYKDRKKGRLVDARDLQRTDRGCRRARTQGFRYRLWSAVSGCDRRVA